MRVPAFARRLRSASFGAALAFLFALHSGQVAAAVRLDAEDLAKVVDPLMAEWMAHGGTGAVVVVTRADATVFAKGYGLADVEAKRPFTPERTLVRPGSISKLFTAISVMQLVDQGKLDLDCAVADYIDFALPTPPGGVPVTLRRLLTHTAGFEDHAKDLFSDRPQPMQLSHWVAKSLPQRLFPSGDIPAYSNYGVALAGYVVQRVSGEAFEDYVERHILKPLGMDHSSFRQPLPAALAPLMAKSYRGPNQPPRGAFETIQPSPAGALSATGEDMARFIRALLNGGELDGARILPRARLEAMMTPRAGGEGPGAGWIGLAFFGRRFGGLEAVGHGGATQAFFSDLELFRDEGFGVFVSRDGFSDMTRAPDVARAIAEHLHPASPSPASSLIADPARFAGVYQSTRRSDSNFFRLTALLSQRLLTTNVDGGFRMRSAWWAFDAGEELKRIGDNVLENSGGVRFAAVDAAETYLAAPAMQLRRAPWFLDSRWIAPAVLAGFTCSLMTLIAWPAAAAWRRWRKRASSLDAADRRLRTAVNLLLLIDVTAAVLSAGALITAQMDPSWLNDATDPLLMTLYALAWLGALGTSVAVFAAVDFWRRGVGGVWMRVHQSALAASTAILAYAFMILHIAGTTLNY
jgi:CubicO group peptidase (beta-lactamase class C family)